MATAVYCSTAMIKTIEVGERQPSVDLAQALQIPLTELLTWALV